MKVAVLSLLVLALVGAAMAADAQRDEFSRWMRQHNKRYTSLAEFNSRFHNYKRSVSKIAQLNLRKDGATYALNEFSDMDVAEFRRMPCGVDKLSEVPLPKNFVLNHTDLHKEVRGLKAAPAAWDWTGHGAVTPIKNQQQCGSCWAFSTIGNIEGVWKLAGHALTSLSEQQEVDCSQDCYGCGGGWPFLAMQDLISDSKGQVDTETGYPYTAQNGQCSFQSSSVGATITGYKSYCTESTSACDETDMMTLLYNYGPLSACLNAGPMQYYQGGIQNPSDCDPTAIDHCITIVGYGTTNGVAFWKIKNSWGTGWGEQGYYQLIRNTGACGINQVITVATV